MKPEFRLIALQNRLDQGAVPTLLVRLDPWHKVFFRNLRDLLWPKRDAQLSLSCPPGLFWNDVFVKSRLPWGRFVESAVLHVAVILVMWRLAQLRPPMPHLVASMPFHSSEVLSYEPSEYLPPLNTGNSPVAMSQSGDPVYAPQTIISVPPESENPRQTVVIPPKLKLNRDIQLPNIVAWERKASIIAPAATAKRISDQRVASSPLVIAPPPDVHGNKLDPVPVLAGPVIAPAPEVAAVRTKLEAAFVQPAVAPPPAGVEIAALRQRSDIDIDLSPAQVVAPAPRLPIDEQQAVAKMARATLGNSGVTVVPPPPSVQVNSRTAQDGRVIALSIRPAPPAAPVEVPGGNRRGSFAATPGGNAGASGTPKILGSSQADATVIGPASAQHLNGVPPGLLVGAVGKAQSGPPAAGDPISPKTDPPLMATATPGRALAGETSPGQESEAERELFGVRKSYSMTLNVPNLNSAGGSLVLHFSELKEGETHGDLFAPVVTRVVAPGYPLELMRQNVQGTVELSAVIGSDGSVSEVRVLNSVDARLEEHARSALLRWQFLPALRNGQPVPLQAVVRMPFKPRRTQF